MTAQSIRRALLASSLGLLSIGLMGCGNSGEIGIGTLGGAAAGGTLGSTVGKGKGQTVAVLGGAILGGIAGNRAVDRPLEEQRSQRREAAREREFERQQRARDLEAHRKLDFERQSALQKEQVRREIEEQRLYEEWKRQRLAGHSGADSADLVTRDDVVTAQRLLIALGHYSGPVDGVAGSGTMAAVRAFQTRVGMPQTGVLSLDLINRMRAAI